MNAKSAKKSLKTPKRFQLIPRWLILRKFPMVSPLALLFVISLSSSWSLAQHISGYIHHQRQFQSALNEIHASSSGRQVIEDPAQMTAGSGQNLASNQPVRPTQTIGPFTTPSSPVAPEATHPPSSNVYVSGSGTSSRLRVNVSNICERQQMRATVRFSRPFYGLIHTKDKRRRPNCNLEGRGEQSYTLAISYALSPADPAHCGVTSNPVATVQPPKLSNGTTLTLGSLSSNSTIGSQNQSTLSVVLVVRLHKTIEFSEDRYFLLSCANRCTRPDCSFPIGLLSEQPSRPANSSGPSLGVNRPIVASESIVSTILKPGTRDSLLNLNSKHAPERISLDWPKDRCDISAEVKFQWLVKICWALALALALIFFVACYLCLVMNQRRLSRAENFKKASIKRSKRSGTISVERRNESTAPLGADRVPGARSSSSGTATSVVATDSEPTLDHQQMRLSNVMVGEQPTARQLRSCTLLLGRKSDTIISDKKQGLEARVRRGRSLGAAHADRLKRRAPPVPQLPGDDHSSSTLSKRNGRGYRRSKSQTTIYYDQNQDPFKTIPFSYLENGYRSEEITTNNSQEPRSLGPNGRYDANQHQIPVQNGGGQFSSYPESQVTHSLPPEIHISSERNAAIDARRQAPSYWESNQNQQAAMNMTMEYHPQQVQNFNDPLNPHINSQFNPQNSLQLIDLLHQKHRQQMDKASKTAACLIPKRMKLFNTSEEQQGNNVSSQQRPPWR